MKLLLGLSALIMLVTLAPDASAGVRWSGIDPELLVDGHRVNIIVAVPPGTWCQINGPIEFTVQVPDLATATLVSESFGDNMYKPGTLQSSSFNARCGTLTQTTLGEHGGDDNHIFVSGIVYAKGNTRMFPVDVAVYVDSQERATCSGRVGRVIDCAPIALVDAPDTVIEAKSRGHEELAKVAVNNDEPDDSESKEQNAGGDIKASGNTSPHNQDDEDVESQPKPSIGSAGHNENKDSNGQSNTNAGASPANHGNEPKDLAVPTATEDHDKKDEQRSSRGKHDSEEDPIMDLSRSLESVTSFSAGIIKIIAKTIGITSDTDRPDDRKKGKARSDNRDEDRDEDRSKGKARKHREK